MRWTGGITASLLILLSTLAGAAELDKSLAKVKAVGSGGKGSEEAAAAWEHLAKAPASDIPQLLAALDDANPLAANWIRGAIDAIVERDDKLPADALEEFVTKTKHDPRGRRLAYELLLGVDDSAKQRLLPKLLNDPSVELRRDAVAWQTNAASFASNKKQAAKLYQQAFAAAVDDDQVKELSEKLKSLGIDVDVARHYGFVLDWHVIGPFDNADEKGYAAVHPLEKRIDLSAKHTASHDQGDVAWKEVASKDDYGRVDLNKELGKHKSAVAYAVNHFQSDAARPVEIRWKSKNACKVWLNGKLVDAREVYHSDGSPSLDQYTCGGELKSGRNTIVIKVCQNDQKEPWAQDWAFQLRVCDAAGAAVLAENRLKK